MSRKSIFERLETEIDFNKEAERLETLFSHTDVWAEFNGDLDSISLEDYIDKVYFKSWSKRGRCLTTYDFREEIDLDYPIATLDRFLDYCEYIANMLLLYLIRSVKDKRQIQGYDDLFHIIIKNIDDCLSELNMQRSTDLENEICLITEINPSATMAADKLNKEKAFKIIQYNHYLLKGDLQRKKEILTSLAGVFEPLRKELKSNGYGNIEDITSFLLNKMNIRHNNLEGTNKFPLLETIREDELEEIYDKTYELILLCINLSAYIKNKGDLEKLKF